MIDRFYVMNVYAKLNNDNNIETIMRDGQRYVSLVTLTFDLLTSKGNCGIRYDMGFYVLWRHLDFDFSILYL